VYLHPILLYSFFSITGPSVHFVEDGWSDGSPAPFWAKRIGLSENGQPFYLRQDAADAYGELVGQAQQAGITWKINSAYRSTTDQRRMLRQRRRWAAPIGMSQHQAGVALDLSGTSVRCGKKRKRRCRSETYRWLSLFGPGLGWHNTAPKEPWHWEYVGTATSEALRGRLRGSRPAFLKPPECQY
jgi:LAS superfamily LD-carboxypeptidase LdcB